MKKKSTSEKRLPDNGVQSPLFNGGKPNPPLTNGVEVQEHVTKATVLDLQRYSRWAEKALENKRNTKVRNHHIRPKAA